MSCQQEFQGYVLTGLAAEGCFRKEVLKHICRNCKELFTLNAYGKTGVISKTGNENVFFCSGEIIFGMCRLDNCRYKSLVILKWNRVIRVTMVNTRHAFLSFSIGPFGQLPRSVARISERLWHILHRHVINVNMYLI